MKKVCLKNEPECDFDEPQAKVVEPRNPEVEKKEAEILSFLMDSQNICNCGPCPYNRNMDEGRADRVYPCGQQNCWVQLHVD